MKHQEQTQKNKKRSLRSPVIFYQICSYLDNETIFECKYVKNLLIKVCASSRKLIKNNEKLENVSLKIELKRVKLLVWGDREAEEKSKNKLDHKKLIDYDKIGKMQLSKEIKKKRKVLNHLEQNEKIIQNMLKDYELTQFSYKQQINIYQENLETYQIFPDKKPYHPYTFSELDYNNPINLPIQNVYRDFYQYKDLDCDKLYKLLHEIEQDPQNLIEKTTFFINQKLNNLFELTKRMPFKKLNNYILAPLLNN